MAHDLAHRQVGLCSQIASSICQSEESQLFYRGYSIEELASYSSMEEVAYLLLRGALPTYTEQENYRKHLQDLRVISPAMRRLLEQLPADAKGIDVLRSGVSLLGSIDPESYEHDPFYGADSMFACGAPLVLYWYLYHKKGVVLDLNGHEDASLATYVLHMLHGKAPSELMRRALDVLLLLYAEHDLTPAAVTARVIASTGSDIHGALTGAIASFSGEWHGGASEAILMWLKTFSTPEAAEIAVEQRLAQRQRILGFGHPVHCLRDPREAICHAWAKRLAEDLQQEKLLQIAERVAEVMWREKKLAPNVSFYAAVVGQLLDIPHTIFTALLSIARIPGWSAHVYEQRAQPTAFWFSSHEVGPSQRDYIHIEDR